MMKKPIVMCLIVLTALFSAFHTNAENKNPNTNWLMEAKYGVFMHFLPSSDNDLKQVDQFDVDALAEQLEDMGARYLVLTLGQNSGYFNSPNAAYEKKTGYAPGERCSLRDLPMDLYEALQPKGIRLMLYLPCQTPNQDRQAQKAFGLPEGAKDQPVNTAFAHQWAKVIQEWSDRYGDKVAGWWFDGGYDHIQFNNEIAEIYADAVKHGNSNAIVTFNPGVKIVRHTKAEDYTAGELNDPLAVVPASRWLDGSQWHALTYLGSAWGKDDTRYTNEQWAKWAQAVVANQGAFTLDMGPNYDPQAGPIGAFNDAQVNQVKAIKAALAQTSSYPKRLKRADSFLGIHFDFHAGVDCTEIGKNTTREMIENIITQVRPDYIQIDCKGHPGLSSYPTKVGNQAPGFVGDPLRLWREVTAEHGVGLYMHYSGVWDSEAIRKHPDWAVINANGTPNENATSFFSAYADELVIPQLRELSGDYGVDGAWVDGECWASQPDYGEAALKAFRETTGIQTVPRSPGDPNWYEFLQFNRECYRDYMRKYIAAVKQTHPEMQICSNWAFTDHMPEEVCAPVDWISGDLSPQDSVNAARLSARFLTRQGKPWDLMAWSFTIRGEKRNGSNQKSAVQLKREAASIISLGGGFQPYYQQKRDGSIRQDFVPTIAEVAKFCRERQAVCHGAVPIPQAALLYSSASHYREINGLFNRDLSKLRGTLQALLEGQQSVEILGEHNLSGRMDEYPLIVIPELSYLEPAFKQELIAYAKNGGNLLLIGPVTASLFQEELGAAFGNDATAKPRYLSHGGTIAAVRGDVKEITLSAIAKPFGKLLASSDANSNSQAAASIAAIGKGRIAATYFPFSRWYMDESPAIARAFLNDLARQLFPSPLVEVSGSSAVDVSVNRIHNRMAINLVNTSGPHADQEKPLHDSIAPVGPLQIKIRAAKKPVKITVEPGGQALAFEYRDGEALATLPELEIHCAVVVE